MTETDYVKERLALLKIGMTAIVGAMFALTVYNAQSSGSKSNTVWALLIVFMIGFIYIGIAYNKLMCELKDLP